MLEKGGNAPPFRHFATTPAVAAGMKHERCAALCRAREGIVARSFDIYFPEFTGFSAWCLF